MSLIFVWVVGFTAITPELGLNVKSVHTRVFPVQPGDDDASYNPKSPVKKSTQRLGSESYVIISVVLDGHGDQDVAFNLDFEIIQYPVGSIVVTSIALTGDGRRELLEVQFHVPTSQLIEEKSGFGGLGMGVLPFEGVVAGNAIDPTAINTTTMKTSARNHRNLTRTSYFLAAFGLMGTLVVSLSRLPGFPGIGLFKRRRKKDFHPGIMGHSKA